MKTPFSRLTVLKLPQTKRFEYSPRHFDERKEKLEKRKKQIAQDLGLNEDSERVKREINFRANLEASYDKNPYHKTSAWTNIRLIVIMGILLMVCYYIYINLDKIMETIVQ